MKLRTFEGNKVLEKHVKLFELVEFLQPRHVYMERSESTESKELTRYIVRLGCVRLMERGRNELCCSSR